MKKKHQQIISIVIVSVLVLALLLSTLASAIM